MKRIVIAVFLGILASTVIATSGWAQGTAEISGSVKDTTGAVLPGVEVIIRQTETGVARMTVTNETGSYVLPNLPLGPYRLEAALFPDSGDGYKAPTNAPIATYGQIVGLVNDKAGERDYVVGAAGGLPGELNKVWRVKSTNSFDVEYGFSCMGYEVAGGWGAAMADPTRETIVMVGDGSYLIMNSDIYSTVLTGHKMIVVICDNGGYGVINRLQNFKGGESYNNLIKDCNVKQPFAVDFAKHAESMGAHARKVQSLAELGTALDWAKTTDRTTVIVIENDAFVWTPGDAQWDVGVPTVSKRKEVNEARKYQDELRKKQRVGV